MNPLMFGVLVFALLFVAVVLRAIFRWRGVWRWLASLPLVVLALAVLNIVLNPNSHNLLPFEIIVWVVLGFIILGVVAAVRSRVLKEPERGKHSWSLGLSTLTPRSSSLPSVAGTRRKRRAPYLKR